MSNAPIAFTLAQWQQAYRDGQSPAELLHALRMSHHGTVESRTLEGIPALGAFWQLEQFGWTVVIGIPLDELQTGWHRAIGFLLLSHLLLFALVMLAAWHMAKRGFVLPTEGLLQRMRRVAAHRSPGPAATCDATIELQSLEACFDELCTRLAQREAEGQDMIRRLSDTLEHMGDGFLALDNAGRITHLNSQAERLLGQLMGQADGEVLGLPAAGVKLSPETASVIAMVINLGAYAAEIIRAGIQPFNPVRDPIPRRQDDHRHLRAACAQRA